MTHKLKVSFELQQIRTGVDGKTSYTGVEIDSTEENIKKEMKDAVTRILGKEGNEMRKRIKDVKALYTKSWKEGSSRAAMEDFGKFAEAH